MIKPIALYLPQFHPIPENNTWWGKGFTEWTNVTKAKPLFKGHWQPRLPSDLGFYDLRVAESRQAQADLAAEYGVYGFCYWHYWFAGKRIIERPFNEMVNQKKPDFPFCIAWANQTWSGTWHGLSNSKVLIEQTYPGKDDFINHFYSILDALKDKRYISIDGKKLIFIYRPMEMPFPEMLTDIWQDLAVKEGLEGIHFVGMQMKNDWDYKKYGYQAITEIGPALYKFRTPTLIDKSFHKFLNVDYPELKRKKLKLPSIHSYKNYVAQFPDHPTLPGEYPMVYPDWDNTPRSGLDGWLFEGSTPELFETLCLKAFKETENKLPEEKIVILKSWNEWAEGNYLEPDKKYGHKYLEAFKRALDNYNGKYTNN